MRSLKYTLEALILDPDFIKWVKSPEEVDGSSWVEWASLSSDNATMLIEAREIVTELSADIGAPGQQELDDLWQRIEVTNSAWDMEQSTKVISLHSRIKFWYSIAAVTVGILLLSIGSRVYFFNGEQEFKTVFGENKTLVLPDRSVVILNANSTVTYSDNWDKNHAREVYLEGEAFFSVIHKNNHQKFIVHTKDLDVQVLGTKFNVNSRHNKTQVMLKSGKVKLFLKRAESKEVDMRPGELVNFSAIRYTLEKKVVKPLVYTAWVEKRLVFEDTSLKDIAQVLLDNYGLKTKFNSPDLAALTFTGAVESGDVNLLLTILQKTFNISITKKEGNLIVSKNL
jgi:transmembrane sensor